MNRILAGVGLAFAIVAVMALPAFAQGAAPAGHENDRIQELERQLQTVLDQMAAERTAREQQIAQLQAQMEELRAAQQAQPAQAAQQPAAPTVTTGFGSIKLGFLLQGWGLFFPNDADTSAEAGTAGAATSAGGFADDDDTFRLRRAEIGFKGVVLADRVEWGIMVDPARAIQAAPETAAAQTRRILQDWYIRMQFPRLVDPDNEANWFTLDLGQFKTGLTWEGMQSSSKLDFMERTFLARTFGDVRDIGAKIWHDYGWLGYSAGIYNGEGQNTISDLNDEWMFVERLVIRPFQFFEGYEESFLRNMEFGVSAQQGDLSISEINTNRHDNGRFGAHFSWEIPHPFSDDDTLWIRGEWMKGRRSITANTTWGESEAWYASTGYRFLSNYELGLRYEHFNPGEVTAFSGTQPFSNVNQWTLGATWYISGNNAKVQFNYTWSDEPGQGLDVDNDTFMFGVQISH